MSRKPRTKRPAGAGLNLASLGLMDINNMNFDEDMDADGQVDDSEFEAELNALIGGKGPAKRKEPKQKRAPVDLGSITALANAALKDDISDHESDAEGLENDEELLAELNEIGGSGSESVQEPTTNPGQITSLTSTDRTPSPLDIVEVLEDRLKNYRQAEEAAKALGETSKARRFTRGVQTLAAQLKQAKVGKNIPEADIPPPVSIPKARPKPMEPVAPPREPSSTPTEPSQVPMEENDEQPPPLAPRSTSTYPPPDIADLLGDDDPELTEGAPPPIPVVPPEPQPTQVPRSIPQRAAPLPPTEPTDTKGLLEYRRDQYKRAALQAKTGGDKVEALRCLKIVKQFDNVIQALERGDPIDLSKMPPPPKGFQAPSMKPAKIPEPQPDIDALPGADPEFYKAPPPLQSILEALQQRLARYEETEAQAKTEGNSSKVRRVGRIVKDYRDAIKRHKAGKPVNFEELPAPPGFGPIPIAGAVREAQPPQPAQAPSPKPTAQAAEPPKPKGITPTKQGAKRQMSMTMEKQRQYLLERQAMFRDAAKTALANGATKEQAVEYLRMSKGIQPMIDATECGLPVDLSSIPTPPQLRQDFEVLAPEECGDVLSADSEELYRTLERDLGSQFSMCTTNKDNFFKLGDVASGTKFEKLGQDTQRDLSMLKACWKRGDTIPKFHYEDRVFTIIRHNHDVAENQIQVEVVRGISLPGKPNELDSYAKIDLAFPTDAPQSYKGYTVKDTTNPEFKTSCSFEIPRKSRSFLRALKRLQLKVEIWSKRGFLRADGLLGTANVKLVDLESKCTIHDVFPLVEGRRETGAKIEVKIRVTEPFGAKQIEEIKERWLVIGS